MGSSHLSLFLLLFFRSSPLQRFSPFSLALREPLYGCPLRRRSVSQRAPALPRGSSVNDFTVYGISRSRESTLSLTESQCAMLVQFQT